MSRRGWADADLRAIADAVVHLLEERGLLQASAGPSRVLDAADVARLLGRDRQWVYNHAGELGAFRFGDGPRARIGFELIAIERWKRHRQIRQPAGQAAERGRRAKNGGAAQVRLIPYDASRARP
jgi:hypothetical protein